MSTSANQTDESMSVLSHLTELRRRLVFSMIAILVGVAVTSFFSKEIYHWLQKPLLSSLPIDSNFIVLSPIEGWFVYLKVALIAAVFATSPIWMYQFWAFITPGLHKIERITLALLGLSSAVLFLGGALICHSIIIPHGFQYFIRILDNTNIHLMPDMGIYFSFMLRLLIAFGLVFEVPIVIIFLARWNIVSLKSMRRARPLVILFAFILAAIITPPDVFTQIAVAIPFIILYEISLLIAWLFSKKK